MEYLNFVEKSNFAQFKKVCLKNKEIINKQDDIGLTLLHYAASFSKVDFVEFLLKHKADVNAFEKIRYHSAISFTKSKKIQQLLLKHGSYPLGTTALHAAAADNDIPKMRKLLKEKPSLLNDLNIKLQTPLFFAVEKNHLRAAKYLVEQGAFVNKIDTKQLDPTFYSILLHSRQTPLTQFLIKKSTLPSSEMNNILSSFRKLLNKEMATANKLNKRLIVLIGEYHGRYRLADLEAKMLKVAKEVGISKLYLEFPKKGFSRTDNLFEKHARTIGFKVDKVDNHIYREQASVQERNIIIARSINDDHGHGVFIGGSGHFSGLLESNKDPIDKKTCQIVPLNLSSILPVEAKTKKTAHRKGLEKFYANKTKVIQVTSNGLSDPKPVISKCNNPIPFKQPHALIYYFSMALVLSALSLPIVALAIYTNIAVALVLLFSSLLCGLTYWVPTVELKTLGLAEYRKAKPEELKKQPIEKLRAFLDGAKETYTEQFKSNFIYRDWYYRKDFYAGRVAARTEETDLIKQVRKCAARAA